MKRFHLMAIVIVLAAIITVTAEETPYPTHDAPVVQVATEWTTVAASGLVEAQPQAASEDSWIRVRRGAELTERTALRTGRQGRATLTRNADLLIVDPNSRLELPAMRVGPEDDSTVVQTHGSVVYEVDGRTTRDFKVVTPYLVAGVKGTVFMVTVNDGSTTVTVEEGIVEVSSINTGQVSDIRAGETVLVDAERGHELEVISRHDRRVNNSDRSDRSRDTRRIMRAENKRLNRVRDRGHEELQIAIEMGDLVASTYDNPVDSGPATLDDNVEVEDRDSSTRTKIEEPEDTTLPPNTVPVPPTGQPNPIPIDPAGEKGPSKMDPEDGQGQGERD